MAPASMRLDAGAGGPTFQGSEDRMPGYEDEAGVSRRFRAPARDSLRRGATYARNVDALRKAIEGRDLSDPEFDRLLEFVRDVSNYPESIAIDVIETLPRFRSLAFPSDLEDCRRLFSCASHYAAGRESEPEGEGPAPVPIYERLRDHLETAAIAPRVALAELDEFEAGLVAWAALVGIRKILDTIGKGY
jgi:hypothetical protein